jgi:hypothetical protein
MIVGAFVKELSGEAVGTLQDSGGKAEYLHIDCVSYEIIQAKKYDMLDLAKSEIVATISVYIRFES